MTDEDVESAARLCRAVFRSMVGMSERLQERLVDSCRLFDGEEEQRHFVLMGLDQLVVLQQADLRVTCR